VNEKADRDLLSLSGYKEAELTTVFEIGASYLHIWRLNDLVKKTVDE